MNRTVWAQVEQLFARISNLPQSEQDAALAASGAPEEVQLQVRELLAFDGAIDLDQWGQSVQQLASSLEHQELCGRELGPWRLMESLGEGGMGRVFLAERCDGRFDAKAAVKFVTGSQSRDLALFDRERRILARLSDPGIARLIDAGEDDRLGAYLVMEYIDGQSLDRVVKDRRLNGPEILRWMVRAAEVVAHAHQNLVLHRDLKPDHLMIDSQGNLKILDFGVASLLQPEYRLEGTSSELNYTPRYAAPEQLRNVPATTQTDVYALGLILYELLHEGQSPFGDDHDAANERKLHGQADRLGPVGGLNLEQMRDLQAILDRCLSPDHEQRYPGPAELAMDLAAVCRDRPVTTRSPGLAEASRRWLRHNRLAGAALSVAVLAMIGGTVVSSWFSHLARLERDSAVIEANKAREVAGFLESIFQAFTPGLESGPDVRARDLLQAGHERIERELSGQPEVAASLELAIARSFLSLGLYDEAMALVQTADQGLPEDLKNQRLLLQARLLLLGGQYGQAEEILDARWTAQLSGNQKAHAANLLATTLLNLGRPEQAEEIALEALEHASADPEGIELQLVTHGLLGAIAFSRRDYVQASRVYREIHALNLRLHGSIHEETAQALHNLAGVLFMKGDLLDAARTYEQALEDKRAYYGVDNRSVAMTLRSLGLSYRRLGRAPEAEHSLRESIAALAAWNDPGSAVYQEAVVQLIELLALLGRDREISGLLASLPELPVAGGTYEKDVFCRIEQIRHTFVDADSRAEACIDHIYTAESTRAFGRYLEAISSSGSDPLASGPGIAEAIRSAQALTPPDPLLLAAAENLLTREIPTR